MKKRLRKLRKLGYRVSNIEEPNGEFICRIEKDEKTERFISKVSDIDALKKAYKSAIKQDNAYLLASK